MPALFRSCLFWSLFAFSQKCMLHWIEVRWLTWPVKNILLFGPNKLIGWFLAVRVGLLSAVQWSIAASLSYCMTSICFDKFAWIWADKMFLCTSAFILLLSSVDINEHKWASSSGGHTCPSHNTTSTMFGRWGGMVKIKIILFSSTLSSFHHSRTGWSLSHLSITLSSRTCKTFSPGIAKIIAKIVLCLFLLVSLQNDYR